MVSLPIFTTCFFLNDTTHNLLGILIMGFRAYAFDCESKAKSEVFSATFQTLENYPHFGNYFGFLIKTVKYLRY